LGSQSNCWDYQHVEGKINVGFVKNRKLVLRMSDLLLPECEKIEHKEKAIIDKDDNQRRNKGTYQRTPSPKCLLVLPKFCCEMI
jgi:hypothetical protein